MSVFIYSLRARMVVAWLILAVLALCFWFVQNHAGWHGGTVALPKLLWLFTAIWAWYIQPALVLIERDAPSYVKKLFDRLLWIMAVRAVLEGIMLYVTLNWSPWYGIAFNVVALAWLFFSWTSLLKLDRHFSVHVLVLMLMFVLESGFAWYMQRYFNTTGQEGVYFVPDVQAHQKILMITWSGVFLSWLWQGWIFRRGLWRTH